MDMKIIKSVNQLCVDCMTVHDVKTVEVMDWTIFKDVEINYKAEYDYCEKTDGFLADEDQMTKNDISLKNAYRKKVGLLTSEDIVKIRHKYGISQGDLCALLGWGGKTITRYESHQVQDKAHDSILRKINDDPEWFINLLVDARGSLSESAFNKYYQNAMKLYEDNKDVYLRKAIEANYVKYQSADAYHGNTVLSLSKVVDVIRYFASAHISNLYKVKLMKMMWYADALAYKNRGKAITGLVYQSLPMGAVPIGHNEIIDLKNVPCEEEDMGELSAYRFYLEKRPSKSSLTNEEKKILDIVIDKFREMTKNEIVESMHNELAYKKTKAKDVISFEYTTELSI